MSEKSIKYEEALDLLKYKSTYSDGKQILEELVSNGDDDAIIALADELMDAGIDFYEMAANIGDARGQYAMGKYFARRSVQEFKKSAEFLEKAAMQGHDDAMDLLGFLLMEGRGKGENRLEKDTKKGIEWLKKAAEQGNKSALYRLGQCYESGNGVEKDSEEALRLYKSSADAGEVRAIDWLNQDVYKRLKALLKSANEKEVSFGDIEKGEGKALYQEMTRAVQSLYGLKASDSDFEIWKAVINIVAIRSSYGESEFLYSYACEVIITLLKKQNIDANQYTRRRLLDGFDIEKLKDIGNKLWRDKNDQKMAVYFYEYIIRQGMATEEDLDLIERAIRYCVNNNEKEKAFLFGNYVIEMFHTSKKLALSGKYKEILGWMCCRNNGYFLTDDRPDENGQYTDHGRIVNEAFYASAIFDGVLE